MDWSDLAPLIADAAPTLGRLLGSGLPIPFGGSVGQAVGQAVAAAIGAEPTPEAVATTLGATPNDVKIAQLASVEAQAKAQWEGLAQIAASEATVGVASVQSVQATIQSELVDGTWLQKSWRPLAMMVWVGSWPFQIGAILYQLGSKDPATITQLSPLLYALTAWNAGPASLAGIYSWGRTREKISGGESAARAG